MAETKSIHLETGIASQSGAGFVMFRLGEEFINLPVEEAERVAHLLLDGAASARADAFIFAFGMKVTGNVGQAGGMLVEYRKFRDQQEGR